MRSSSAIVEGTVGCAGVKERCSRHHDILSFVYWLSGSTCAAKPRFCREYS